MTSRRLILSRGAALVGAASTSLLLPQIVRDLRVTRIFEGPTEALACFIGKRIRPDAGSRLLDAVLNDASGKARLQAADHGTRIGVALARRFRR